MAVLLDAATLKEWAEAMAQSALLALRCAALEARMAAFKDERG